METTTIYQCMNCHTQQALPSPFTVCPVCETYGMVQEVTTPSNPMPFSPWTERQALVALKALIQGVYNDPQLLKAGSLHENKQCVMLWIIETALKGTAK